MTALKVLEIAHVRPFSDSPASAAGFFLPLTFFDVTWLKFAPMKRVFFYQVTDLTPSLFESMIVPRLKTSLSLTLPYFLPLAGRLVWHHQDPLPHIAYSPGDVVSFTVAESDADLALLSGDQPRQASLLRPLVPELEASDHASPVITLQATFFPNQGFCIGISANHIVLDGKSTTMFIKAWAHVCKTGKSIPCPLPEDLTPFLDRTVIKDPAGLAAKYLNTWISLDPRKSLKPFPHKAWKPDLLRATFQLTGGHINELRNRIKNESQDPSQLRLSTFVLTFAYVMTCMVKARGGDREREVGIVFPADYRARFDPPVPSTYFGNCVGGAGRFDCRAEEFMGDNGFLRAVEKISEMVSDLDIKALEKVRDIIESVGKMKPNTQFITASGSNHFGVYSSDFGWGRPQKVELVSIDTNQSMSLAESRHGNGGGVELGMCLEGRELEIFTSLFWDGINSVCPK